MAKLRLFTSLCVLLLVACAGDDPKATPDDHVGEACIAGSTPAATAACPGTSTGNGVWCYEDIDVADEIVHGGDSDGVGTTTFKSLSTAYQNGLTSKGQFSFICDHGKGHTVPPGIVPVTVQFFADHPFNTVPDACMSRSRDTAFRHRVLC